MNRQAASIKVFVYGTLMRENSNHRYLEDTMFISNAKISGYELFDATQYFPGILPGSGEVYGEVYEINKDVLDRLDNLEGEGFLYRRKQEKATDVDGTVHDVYVYMWMRGVSGCKKTKTPWVPLQRRGTVKSLQYDIESFKNEW